MQLTRITPENVHDFPVGTVVVSNYGAGYPDIEGVVIGQKILPATKFFPASAYLVVRQDRFVNEFDETVVNETTVSQLYETEGSFGIGTYLIEKAEKPSQKSNSPWSA
jgi:hypothetical protein